jgi:hypothetical protein
VSNLHEEIGADASVSLTTLLGRLGLEKVCVCIYACLCVFVVCLDGRACVCLCLLCVCLSVYLSVYVCMFDAPQYALALSKAGFLSLDDVRKASLPELCQVGLPVLCVAVVPARVVSR